MAGAIVPVLVPAPRPKTTVAPPTPIGLPLLSRSVSVMRSPVPDASVAPATMMVECDRLRAPGVTVITGSVEVTATPLMVAVTVFVPIPMAVNVEV